MQILLNISYGMYGFVALGFLLEAYDPKSSLGERILACLLAIFWPVALALKMGMKLASNNIDRR